MRDWFKARNIWGAAIMSLTDDEAGRLAKALWAFTMNGEIVPLEGAGKGIFALMRITLEQDSIREADISEKRSMATASRRQKPSDELKQHQMISIDIKSNQMTSNDDNKNKNKKEESEKEKESESFLSDDAAAQILNDHNAILDAAQNAGFKSSPAERAGLLNLYAVHGLDKMLNGINECVKHSAPNLAYLEAVLKGTGKKPGKDYEQRDYTGEQEAALQRMMQNGW